MHQRTVPYSPQQNGVAERMNRTIMEKARSMLHYKSVSTEWWAEAVHTAVYLINRSSNTAHVNSTSYELSFKVKPHMEHLRVFGSQGYAQIDGAKRTKLESKSFRCMFLGYAENVKGYRLFDLDDAKVKMSRSVKLDKREVGGIYDTQSSQLGTVIQMTTERDDGVVPIPEEFQPIENETMEPAEETVPDVDMDEVEPEQEATQLQLQLQLPPHEPALTGHELVEFHSPPPAYNWYSTPRRNARGIRGNQYFCLRTVWMLMKNDCLNGVMDLLRQSEQGLTKKHCFPRLFWHMLQVSTAFRTRRTRMQKLSLVTKQLNGVKLLTRNSSRMIGTIRGLSFHVDRVFVRLDAAGYLPRNVTKTVE